MNARESVRLHFIGHEYLGYSLQVNQGLAGYGHAISSVLLREN